MPPDERRIGRQNDLAIPGIVIVVDILIGLGFDPEVGILAVDPETILSDRPKFDPGWSIGIN